MESRLLKLLSKKSLDILGLMSGTSLDGLDLALCRISKTGSRYKIKLLQTGYEKYPLEIFRELMHAAGAESLNKAEIVGLELGVGPDRVLPLDVRAVGGLHEVVLLPTATPEGEPSGPRTRRCGQHATDDCDYFSCAHATPPVLPAELRVFLGSGTASL